MFRKLANLAAAAMAAVALMAMSGCGSGGDTGTGRPPDYRSALAGAPRPLARLYGKGDQLLRGGPGAFRAELDALRGYPVVVNKWASWCGPCRFEFPWFQSLAEKRGGQIAFLGVNSNDSDGSAEQFLSELPLPYPSYADPDLKIAQELGGPPQAFPTTTFYDRTGKLVFTHPGVYQDESDLVADVERYAGG
jgi:cytochrome c biogenesis protein CcmG/thiol:disulfide interchange protein DsbE